MLDERKTAILRAVVQEYISTAQPVGSGHIASSPGVQVSSATVRNEMAVLEQEGYLQQPHTSAGRIPTDKGYRFFVDHLAEPGRLDAARTQQVRTFFEGAHGALERMLEDTSRLLNRLTNQVAVVVGPGQDTAVLRSVQLVGLGPRTVLVVSVLSNGAVRDEHLDLAEDTSDARLAAATAHLSAQLVGSSPASLPALTPTGDPATDALCDAAVAMLRPPEAAEHEQLYLGGRSAVAAAFDAVEVVRDVLSALEQQYVVVGLVRDILERGLTVSIGAEHGVEPLAACSIVVAPYLVAGEPVGTVGVLGPTRMNYPQALAAVEVVSERLGRRLTEG
jgi:heat-inducible transcriptional repressor